MTEASDVKSIESRQPSTSWPAREAACDASLGELHREILRLCAPTLSAAGIPARNAVCSIQREATGLRVQFTLPKPVSAAVKQALAVRVVDAVRSAGRTYGPARVSVHVPG
jgi:hypothetical protein